MPDPRTPHTFRPGELWPDTDGVPINAHGGGILLHDGVYYWFGEHKIAGEAGNAAHVGVGVYSSTDLYAWTNRGVALAVSDDPASDITRGCVLERPKVVFNRRTGKFVMWFHLELKGQGYKAARSGVAVADAPTGPYTFLRSFRPNAGAWAGNFPEAERHELTAAERDELARINAQGGPAPGIRPDLLHRRDFAGGQMARDMTVYVDDDGHAYHLYASEENATLQISLLSDDYLAPAGQYARAFPGGFHEAPAVFKRRGRYYLFTSHCSGWSPNPGRLAVADHLFGPWRGLGNPCVGTDKQQATTFESQSTFVLPVAGRDDAFVFMADRWRPKNAIDGRYVWLPIEFRESDGVPLLRWRDEWDLRVFG